MIDGRIKDQDLAKDSPRDKEELKDFCEELKDVCEGFYSPSLTIRLFFRASDHIVTRYDHIGPHLTI